MLVGEGGGGGGSARGTEAVGRPLGHQLCGRRRNGGCRSPRCRQKACRRRRGRGCSSSGAAQTRLQAALAIDSAILAKMGIPNAYIETLPKYAENLLQSLRLWYPGHPQTLLNMNKIQYNKDVGQSILESYSSIMESLAFNIMARIDDLI